jgi:hypothetical protein
MARSTYIYIVKDKHDGFIHGAWTVKHEMVAWLKSLESAPSGARAFRIKDGDPGEGRAAYDLGELLGD